MQTSRSHGYYYEPLYRHYKKMLVRCGERTDCISEFKDYLHFKKWALDNGYVKGLHLCRNGDKGNYSPTNTRWDTPRANAIEATAHNYILESPNGMQIKVYNLREFCRNNNLTDTNLHKTFTGKREHHKGWKMIEKLGKHKGSSNGICN